MSGPQNIINHVGLVLDASSSMHEHQRNLVAAADGLVKHLATRSTEMDQETRISVWTFSYANRIRCLVWDKDVLRLPSIRSLYEPEGMTALIDGTVQAITDLRETPERYGDHSFLLYVLTDGMENHSRRRPQDLQTLIHRLPGNWTLAALVPDRQGVQAAIQCGFPAGNVEQWDTTSRDGATRAGDRILRATDSYMQSRATGVRSTTTLFSTGAEAVNRTTVAQANLVPLSPGNYRLVHVARDTPIKEFTEQELGTPYQQRRGYYQLTKTVTIQSYKEIAIVEKRGKRQVFVGAEARKVVGLPDMDVRVGANYNPDYDVFVQSTSTNRKLLGGTDYLYLL